MAYRPDFYMVQNIIGYTGHLNDFPTVYFQKGQEYGHITQKHPISQNVGRMAVKSSATYQIGNEIVRGVLKLVERENGMILHESRSTLTRVDTFDPRNRDVVAVLAQAIYQVNDGEKYITEYRQDDFEQIDAAVEAKKAVLKQLVG